MFIITGANDNHYLSLINFINSFIHFNDVHSLIIYNLGLSEENWRNLQQMYIEYGFIYKIFDYSKYPEWSNLNIDAGQYAWKPAIIYNPYVEYPGEIIVWMDAGNIIHNKPFSSISIPKYDGNLEKRVDLLFISLGNLKFKITSKSPL